MTAPSADIRSRSALSSDTLASLPQAPILGKAVATPPPPKSLFIEVTSECALRCRQCHLWRTREPAAALTTSEKVRLIHELSDWNGEATVVLTGGETMQKQEEFFALTRACLARGLSSCANTNGTAIDCDEIVDRLLEEGPRFLVLSLDSRQAALHDWIRGIDGTFDRVVSALRRLVQRRREHFPRSDVQILTSTIIFDQNLDELADYVAFAESLGVDGVMFQMLARTFANTTPHDTFFERHFPRDIGRFDAAIDALLSLQLGGARIRTSCNDLNWMKLYVRNPDFIGEQVCGSGERNMMIDQQGDVQLCFAMKGLLNGRSLGNVRQRGLRSLWESELAGLARGIMGSCRRNCGMLNCHRKEA